MTSAALAKKMFRKAGQFVRGRRPSAGRANDSEGDVSSDDASGASAGRGASAAPAVEAMDIHHAGDFFCTVCRLTLQTCFAVLPTLHVCKLL